MEFTQAEAKEKEHRRQWVRTRDNSFREQYGIPAGMWGRVLSTHRTGKATIRGLKEVWGVNVCFYPAYIIIRNISKDCYESSLLEM